MPLFVPTFDSNKSFPDAISLADYTKKKEICLQTFSWKIIVSEHQQLLRLLIHVNEYTFLSGLSSDIFQVSFMPLYTSHSQGSTVPGTFQTKRSSRVLKLPQQIFSALGANVCYILLYHSKCVELGGQQEKDSILSGGYCPQLQKGEVTGEALILDARYKMIKRTLF